MAASGDDAGADDVLPDDTGGGSSSSPRVPPSHGADPASGGTTTLEDDDDFEEEEDDVEEDEDDFGENDQREALNGALTDNSDNERDGSSVNDNGRGKVPVSSTPVTTGAFGEVPCPWPDTDSALEGRMRNKRKNFQPKNIAASAVFTDSNEEEDSDDDLTQQRQQSPADHYVNRVDVDGDRNVISMSLRRSMTTAPLEVSPSSSPVVTEEDNRVTGVLVGVPERGDDAPLDLSDSGASMRRKSQPVKRVALNSVAVVNVAPTQQLPRRFGFSMMTPPSFNVGDRKSVV